MIGVLRQCISRFQRARVCVDLRGLSQHTIFVLQFKVGMKRGTYIIVVIILFLKCVEFKKSSRENSPWIARHR